MTIMTQVFAEKCGLAHLIDKRFQGVAVGVGSSKIIGRIHAAPLKVRPAPVARGPRGAGWACGMGAWRMGQGSCTHARFRSAHPGWAPALLHP